MKIAAFYENIHDGVRATGQRMENVLTELHDAGMELLYLSPDAWKRDRKELSRIMERLDLLVEGMFGSCDFPNDPETIQYQEMLDLAAEADAGNFLIIPGMLTGGNTQRDLERMVTGTRKAVEYGGKKNVPVLMEDFDGLLSPYNCIAGLQYFMNSVEGLGCAFDTGNFAAFREDELEAFELFADRIRTVHLKDRAAERPHPGGYANVCADLKPAYSCALGSGSVRIREILWRLKERAYAGNVIVELYGDDPEYMLDDIVSSIRWVKSAIG